MLRMFWKFILWIIVAAIAIVILFIGWQTVTEFKPPAEDVLLVKEDAPPVNDTISLITWNVGYFGLGSEMDFFYEGGLKVRPDKDLYEKYKDSALNRLNSFNQIDLILLQELDTSSKRSYYDNQLMEIRDLLKGYYSFYAANYQSWVPIPLTKPMGKVSAGLVSLSKYQPVSGKRVSFGSSYSWPTRLAQLKRCFLELRFNTPDNKELIVINTHNSAFADAADLREKELGVLRKLLLDEYKQGNYVIVGGDWNQNPPMYDTSSVAEGYKSELITPGFPDDFLPDDWNYAYDSKHNTNRNVSMPYTEGITKSTLIDFFVVSPNIDVIAVKTILTGFRESDHQPVMLNVVLNGQSR